jgi:hypothetical protein
MGSHMADYRLYFLDDAGHIRGVISYLSENDDTALEEAKQHVDGRDLELWNLGRLVRKLPHKD